MSGDGKKQNVTSEDVVKAYRMFLGRDPENTEVVQSRVESGIDIHALGRLFATSHEFLDRYKMHSPAMTGREPRLHIQESASEEEMSDLFRHIHSVWSELGKSRPHWSVLSVDEFDKESLETSDIDSFYKTGGYATDVLFETLKRNDIETSSLQSCLEIGCGLGRVTGHLAKRFDRVSACDISQPHLEAARHESGSNRQDNIEYWQLESVEEIGSRGSFDLIYSIIVLQHNPPPVILEMIRLMCESLTPGGVAFFQVPTYIDGYRFELHDYLEGLGDFIEMHCVHQSSVFKQCEKSDCSVLEVLDDSHTGYKERERSNTFVVQRG